MGLPFAQYIEERKAEHGEEKQMETMQRKDMKRKLLEHETIYGTGKPLTPINNMTMTPNKSRRMLDPKSRVTPGSSMRKLNTLERLGHPSSAKRVSENAIRPGEIIILKHGVAKS